VWNTGTQEKGRHTTYHTFVPKFTTNTVMLLSWLSVCFLATQSTPQFGVLFGLQDVPIPEAFIANFLDVMHLRERSEIRLSLNWSAFLGRVYIYQAFSLQHPLSTSFDNSNYRNLSYHIKKTFIKQHSNILTAAMFLLTANCKKKKK
jgi:hypothetical protein